MKGLKISGIVLLLAAFSIVGYQYYFNNIAYRMTEISPNKVYSSGTIPPSDIKEHLKKYGIKTVIDLRNDENYDPLNPSSKNRITLEKEEIDKIENVKHIHIPSGQTPSNENLSKFFKVMDDTDSYPVLIHCHHGIGRAVLYSALYRIEYEKYENEAARQKTRFPLIFSNFSKESSKGQYLINYTSKRSFSVN